MALEKVPGAQVGDVKVGSAEVAGADSTAILEAIRKAGYEPRANS